MAWWALVLEEPYDLWDYFDEKRDALERFETHRGGAKTKTPRAGPSSCTIVQ
jgi:hypothetical protein